MLIDNFKNDIVINEEELRNGFFKMYPKKNENNYYYYLMRLYKINVLYKYNKNKLKLAGNRKKFTIPMELDNALSEVLLKITPGITIAIWNTTLFSSFMSLQLMHNIITIEVPYYAKDIVLNKLLECNLLACLDKDYETMLRYRGNRDLYIVRSMNQDYPIVSAHPKDNKSVITVPKIEKLLVDLIIDDIYNDIFSSELEDILRSILSSYQINLSTMLRYAKKRYSDSMVLETLASIGFDIESGEFL